MPVRRDAPSVFLNIASAQAENTMVLERVLPCEKFLFRHFIAATRLLDCDHAARHCRHDGGFAAGHPPPRVLGR